MQTKTRVAAGSEPTGGVPMQTEAAAAAEATVGAADANVQATAPVGAAAASETVDAIMERDVFYSMMKSISQEFNMNAPQ